jgi:hypothetical protein
MSIQDMEDVIIWYKENNKGQIVTKFLEKGHMHSNTPWTLSMTDKTFGLFDPYPDINWKFINGWVDKENGELQYSHEINSLFDDKNNVMEEDKVNLYDELMTKSVDELHEMFYDFINKNNPFAQRQLEYQKENE